MILGWPLTIFLTIEYISYICRNCETRHTLDEILIQVTRMNQRHNL